MILVHTSASRSASTWMEALLLALCEELGLRCEPRGPEAYRERLAAGGLRDGTVHPAVFLTWPELELDRCRHPWRVLHVRRDPRDMLVSQYWSNRVSHVRNPTIDERRAVLTELSAEAGLLWLLPIHARSVEILLSHQGIGRAQGCLTVEFDALVADPRRHLRALLDFTGWHLPARTLRDLVEARSFEHFTGGRPRGREDRGHHFRKGTSGDWREAFTPAVTEAYKERFGAALVQLGYEPDLAW